MYISLLLLLFRVADGDRNAFVQTQHIIYGVPHSVLRESLFDSVVGLYKENITTITQEYPPRIIFANERAVDTGGVSCDMYSAFFDEVHECLCDGNALLTLAIHPHTGLHLLPIIGAIISHAYLACGMLPVRIAFPNLAQCLLGVGVTVKDNVLLQAFRDGVSVHEASIIAKAFENIEHRAGSFSDTLQMELMSIMSVFGCREIPTPNNLERLITEVAHYEYMSKPTAATVAVHSGVPKEHTTFWENMGVSKLFTVYQALSVSSDRILRLLDNASGQNPSEERIIVYLR